jgi:hypothetical protein
MDKPGNAGFNYGCRRFSPPIKRLALTAQSNYAPQCSVSNSCGLK